MHSAHSFVDKHGVEAHPVPGSALVGTPGLCLHGLCPPERGSLGVVLESWARLRLEDPGDSVAGRRVGVSVLWKDTVGVR